MAFPLRGADHRCHLPSWAAEAFPDLDEDVRQSIVRIKANPFVPKSPVVVTGVAAPRPDRPHRHSTQQPPHRKVTGMNQNDPQRHHAQCVARG